MARFYSLRGGVGAVLREDHLDRGPAQLGSVDTVRRMVDAGSALALR